MINPTSVEDCYRAAWEFQSRKDFAQARVWYVRALGNDGRDVNSIRGFARLLGQIGDMEECERQYKIALSYDPHSCLTWHDYGVLMMETRRVREAIECFDRVLRIAPISPLTLRCRADAYLTLGEWKAGWRDYGWRHVGAPSRSDAPAVKRITKGVKKLLLCIDCGRGDILTMMRYLPWLASMGIEVTCEAHSELLPLIVRMPGVVAAYSMPDDWSMPYGKMPHCAWTSLPAVHMNTEKTDGTPLWNGPYIPNPAGKIGTGEVGYCWHGNKSWHRDDKRSMGAADGANLTKSLECFDAVPLMPDANKDLTDYYATTQVCAGMRAVVTTDTSVAHLAPAMGIPTYVLMGDICDWRWGLHGTDSIWYPGVAHVCRQDAPGDWGSAIGKAMECLSP